MYNRLDHFPLENEIEIEINGGEHLIAFSKNPQIQVVCRFEKMMGK